MKKYLGLDLGEVSLGIARSDSGIIATALTTYKFERENYLDALNYISTYINTEGIDVVVLGLPKHMHNEIGIKGELSIKFKEGLEKLTKAEIVLWDERLTTRQATFTLKEAGLSDKKRKENKDKLAAQLILQNYLDYKLNK
ncbi:MAG: Holliday junction resolvase RuvX [Acholeplasmatales bacterium]